ncbi:N-acetylmuramoyl-L-alanine amidase [Candidatus Woesearchaeota archaeon]|nr:N-acetylmuramoyl-L-alanine amidase [Candidatus Woesearchaeota archaeon]
MALKHVLLSVLTATSVNAATIVLDPGHEPWGDSVEAKANLTFAQSLERIIARKHTAFLTLNENGYAPLLVDFEKNHRQDVTQLRREYTGEKDQHMQPGMYFQMLHVRSLFFQPQFKTYNADLFVSIHYNAPGAGGSNKLHGFCIYYSACGPRAQESRDLAIAIRNALVANGYTKSTTGGEKDGILAVDFTVLHHANKAVPGVLIELGYITNKGDRAAAFNNDAVAKKASVIYKALDDFLSRRK